MVAIHELGTDGNRSRGLVEGQEPWDACWESKNGKGHVCRSSGGRARKMTMGAIVKELERAQQGFDKSCESIEKVPYFINKPVGALLVLSRGPPKRVPFRPRFSRVLWHKSTSISLVGEESTKSSVGLVGKTIPT